MLRPWLRSGSVRVETEWRVSLARTQGQVGADDLHRDCMHVVLRKTVFSYACPRDSKHETILDKTHSVSHIANTHRDFVAGVLGH